MTKRRMNWILLAAAATWMAAGCDSGGIKTTTGTGTGGTQTSNTPGGKTGGKTGSTTTTEPELCSGKGPIVTIPGTTTTKSYQTCTGRIAETRFMNALCTCNNANINGFLLTRAFDSKRSTTEDLGGSVGINNTYLNAAGFSDVGGSFSIAGNDSINLAGYLKTGGDFRVQGTATVAGYTEVGRNLWLGHGYTDLGPVRVVGDLHSSGNIVAIPLLVSGKQYKESVSVPPPCPCEAKDMLDVASMVAEAKTKNDNATAGIVPSMFNTLIGYATATLSCGKYYIESIGGVGDVIFKVTGRTALFVDGSIKSTGNLEFQLSPGAEIDVFIRDNLTLTGRATFGQKDHPASSRIYVGGDGDVVLVGDGEFVGNLYAPKSLVRAVGYGHFMGSVFARDFECPGFASFSYDKAIMDAGDSCTTPPPPAGTCNICDTCTGGTACVDGKCGACRTDADCCSQLICTDGKCGQPGKLI